MVIKTQKMHVTFLGKGGGEQYFMRTSYDDNISKNQTKKINQRKMSPERQSTTKNHKFSNLSPQSTYRNSLLKSLNSFEGQTEVTFR